MKNKKALFLALFGLILSGCTEPSNPNNPGDKKDEVSWNSDSKNHWKLDGETKTEEGAHTFEKDEAKSEDAGCTTAGQLVEKCSVCGYEKTTSIQKLGHNYVEDASKGTAATCSQAGTKVEVCNRCQDEKSTPIAQTSHNYVAKNDATHTNTASTCKVAGKHWEYCEGCKNWKQVDDALSTNHSWNDGVVTKQPTTSTSGVKTFTCSVCNKTKTESIAPTGGSDLPQGAFTFNDDITKAQAIHTTDQANFLKFSGDYYNITSTQLNSYNAKGTSEASFPKQVTVTWNHTAASGKTVKNYQFFTGQKSDLSDGYMITGTTAKSISFYNAFIGDNYFRVIANYTDGSSESSEIKTFKVEDVAPRNLKVGTMSNCRDMGGRTTVAGGKIKQGLIYRTSDPSTSGVGDVSEWTKRMGIKTEIYVKDGGNSTGYSGPLGSSVYYVNASMDYGATPYSNLSRNAERLRSVFNVLGNEDNYPLMYHCRIGTDRTGICGVAINGLIGVPFNEVIQDYAFSNFGKIDGQRYAHKTPDSNGDDIAKYIDEITKMPGKNFQEQMYYSLLTIGIPATTLNKVIDIMTDGAKATLPTNITVANGNNLTNNGGTKKTASDFKDPDIYYQISGSSKSVSYKYNASKAGEYNIVTYLGCTDSSSSKKLADGITLKIDGTAQTIVDKTYQLAGFGTTQQARRTGYMFSILGKYNLTAGEHTIEIAGKNSDTFNMGSIAIIGGDGSGTSGDSGNTGGGTEGGGTTNPPITGGDVKFDITASTGFKSASDKMKSDAVWAVNSTTLPAGNYKVSVEFKITSSTHGSETLWNDASTPVYTLYVGSTAFQPTDKTTTRTNLGLTTGAFKSIEFVSSVAVPAGTTEIKLAYTGTGYSMYCNGLTFSPIA